MITYRQFDVPVREGSLAVGRWGQGDRLVIASHGITANHVSWQRVGELAAEADPTLSVVAIDHRGRGGSARAPGPYGLATHADDLITVLDHLGGERAVFAGHSMGAFVVAFAAERHPDRVRRLVMVDGGLPLPLDLPEDVEVEAVVQSVIGPALDRLDQRWPDVDAYVQFFAEHPAFQPPNEWPRAAQEYVRYDAVELADGQVRSSVTKDAVLVDGGAAIVDPHASSAIERITTDTTLLWAPRGILDQAPGLYSPAQITAAEATLGHLTTSLVEGSNHYTVLVGEGGAAATAAVLLESQL